MKYGIHIANFGPFFDPHVLVGLAQIAEDSGWDGFYLWDHILFWNEGNLPTNDPWVALAAIALQTKYIRLGPLVTALARRRPWKVAREAVTLDHLSNGRLTLGVGLGHPPIDDFSRFGENPDQIFRAQQLDEALDILVGLWSGAAFSYQGKHYQIQDGTIFLPKPVQSPRIPIWVAGYIPHTAPFRRAARWDGVVPGKWDDTQMTPDDVKSLRTTIRSLQAEEKPFDIVMGFATDGKDKSLASSIVTPYAEAGVTWWLEPIDPWRGSLEEMEQRISQGPPRTV